MDQSVGRWPGQNTLADGGPFAALEAIAEHRSAKVGGADAALNESCQPATFDIAHGAAAIGWDAFHSPRCCLPSRCSSYRRQPGGFGAYRDGFENCRRAASQNEELVVLSDVSHYDLYGQPNRAGPALDKLIPFLAKNL